MTTNAGISTLPLERSTEGMSLWSLERGSSTTIQDVLTTENDVTIHSGLPAPPENLTLSLILTTAITLRWSVPRQDIREFYICVQPLRSDWIPLVANDSRLAGFELTGIAGWRRSFSVRELLPGTRYAMYMLSVSAHGVSNASQGVYFTTLPDTPESRPSLSVKPVEIFLVLCILVTWLLAIAMFLRKWGALRIINSSEVNYRAKKPQGLDTIQVVDAPGESVINFGYSKKLCKTMAERQKRFERMHTMPNLKIDLESDQSEEKNAELEPRPRFNSAGSKPTLADSSFNLKSVNPMSFAIPTMIVKGKSPKVMRQGSGLDPCIEESYGSRLDTPKHSSCLPHSSHLPYLVSDDDTNAVNTSAV